MYINKTLKSKRYNQRWSQFSPKFCNFNQNPNEYVSSETTYTVNAQEKQNYFWRMRTCPIKYKATELLIAVKN